MLGLGAFWRKPRTFDYKPRFFDPEKEAREERRKELCGDDSEQEPEQEYRPGQYIRKNMYARRGIGSSRQDAAKKAVTMRRYILMGLVGLVIIWWFFL